MPDNTPYQDRLLQTVDKLFTIRHEVFDELLNLAMAGEMKEIDDAFEVGDEFQFELESFEDSSDTNVNLLMDLVKQIQNVHDSICNLNNIGFDNEDESYHFK